jgi:uncharacterized protein
MQEFLIRTSHKLRPMPTGRWAMSQRWNDLLYAHWPIPVAQLAAQVPDWLEVDTFQGSAWLGVVPFWLDRIKVRGVPMIPGARSFPDLTLRTYVHDQYTGTAGIYCFSVDASNVLVTAVARMYYHLPYHWAEMGFVQRSEREFGFYSRRHFTKQPVVFKARYRGLGPTSKTAEIRSGTLESFFTERNCVFSSSREGQPFRANLHSVPWPLEEAEAVIERNDLATSIGIKLPDMEPVLHYSRRLAIYIWPKELLQSARATQPVQVAVTPAG